MQKPRFSMRLTSLMLVFIILFSMWSPSMFALGEKEQGEEEQDKPTQMEVLNEDEEDGSGEDQEEVVKEDPKAKEEPKEEEIVEEETPQPEKKAEEPKKEEAKKEEVKKEEKTQEKKEEVKSEKVLEIQDIRLDKLPDDYLPGPSKPIINFESVDSGTRPMIARTMMISSSTGQITTSKVANPVPGMVNTWDITVRVEGQEMIEERETVDIVLVIDTSGSMADYQRMTKAKTAAKNFIDQMADGYTKIAIVSFATDATVQQSTFISDKTTLKNKIESLSATGGTHTQAGILQGKALFNSSTADNRYMVLLSDGEPTFSYEPKNWTTVNEIKPGAYNVTAGGFVSPTPNNLNYTNKYGVYNGQYNNTRVGSGNTIRSSRTQYNSRYWPVTSGGVDYYPATRTGKGNSWNPYVYNPVNLDYIDNGLAAIKAANDTKPIIDGLYSIAFGVGTEGQNILQQIASPGLYYATDDQGSLDEIYDNIGTSISTYLPFRNGIITDEMGDGFKFVEMRSVSHGNISDPQITYASGNSNDKIVWDVGSGKKIGNGPTHYAEMTYRVEINDKILTLDGALTDDHKKFETNKITNFNYKDIDNGTKTKDITSPEVDPVLLKVSKILTNPTNPENRKFNVEIRKDGTNPFNKTVELVPNGDYEWITSLRHEGTYSVEEVSVTGDGMTNIGGFDISYEVDGENKTTFQVGHDSQGVPRGDVSIKVTNKQYGDAEPDEPLIRVSKTFSGLTEEQINQLTGFKITITSQDGTLTKDLYLTTGNKSIETNGDVTYKWEIEGWPAGTYTVTESGETLENYEIVTENIGTVTTEAATVIWNPALWKKPNTQVNNDLKKDGIAPNIVATKLSTGEGVFVWTRTRLSASQRLAVVNALSSWNELGLTMSNGYWYSGEDDIAGDNFYFRGYKIQYNLDTGILHIPQSNQWALIVSGAYSFEGGDPADIAVKNSYTLSVVDVTIAKEVTGNYADYDREFEFELQVSGEQNPREFSLKDGNSQIYNDIPKNAELKLKELLDGSEGYIVTVKVGQTSYTPDANGEYIIQLTGEPITIEVNNHKDATIDTGISTDSLPYILVLALAGSVLGFMIIRRRKLHQ